jgi:hypothetical protein
MTASCDDGDKTNRIVNNGVSEAQLGALKVALAASCFTVAAVVTGNDVTVAAGGVATVLLEAETIIDAYVDTFDQVQTLRG